VTASTTDLLAEQVIAPAAETSGGEPLAPETPTPAPAAPSSAIGGAGCGGQGAGQGSQKGAAASAAAVLGVPFEISLAVNDAGLTAPEAGSPTTTATDPATRPD
jgi:hypothetical protein